MDRRFITAANTLPMKSASPQPNSINNASVANYGAFKHAAVVLGRASSCFGLRNIKTATATRIVNYMDKGISHHYCA
jgi:hypothetical protein